VQLTGKQHVTSQPKSPTSAVSTSAEKIGTVRVVVKQGDITKEHADMIVNPTGPSFNLNGKSDGGLLVMCGTSVACMLL